MKKIFLLILCMFSFSGTYAAGDISDETFTIEVNDFTPGGHSFIGNDSDETTNNVLLSVMQKLVIFSGVLAVLYMVIGGGFMIFSHGDDGTISRGKSMFTGGIIAMVVILSAGVLVQIMVYILY